LYSFAIFSASRTKGLRENHTCIKHKLLQVVGKKMINLAKPQHAFLLNSRQTENLRREDMLTQMVVKHIHRSLVAIYAVVGPGAPIFRGSGFLALGNILTAAHVLYDVTEVPSPLVGEQPVQVIAYPDQMVARIQTPLPQRFFPLDVNNDTDLDLSLDVAMITLNPSSMPSLKELEISKEALQPGDSCLCCGTDANLEVIVSLGKVGNAVGQLYREASTLPYGAVYLSARADAGHSGCPIVRPIDGSLIGILGGAFNCQGTGFTFVSYMIPLDVIMRASNHICTRRFAASQVQDEAHEDDHNTQEDCLHASETSSN